MSARNIERPEQLVLSDVLQSYYGNECPPAGYELMDRKNFRIPFEKIRHVRFDDSGLFWMSGTPNSGSVRIKQHGGSEIRLILLGSLDQSVIKTCFSLAGYAIT